MSKRSILHMLDPMPHNSPFDVNMALDAGYDVLMPYANIELEEVGRLTQDAIFSRGPSGVKKTGMFIGGRDIGLAMDMLEAAKKSMVPPFEISVFADPSGAFTTSAALVACVESELKKQKPTGFEGSKVIVFGGTGPVGMATAVIAALQGAETTIVDHASLDTATALVIDAKQRYGVDMKPAVAATDSEKAALITDVEAIFCTAIAGVEVLSKELLAEAKALKVAGDVNAVPPAGVAGVGLMDLGIPLNGGPAVGVGPLAVGNVKYKVQQAMLKQSLEAEKSVYLDFRNAFEAARELV